MSNAGIQPLGIGFAQLTGDLLRRTLEVNVNGVAFGIKYAEKFMEDNGRIINLGSFVGMLADPRRRGSLDLQAAVIHLTRLGAIQLAPCRHYGELRQPRHDSTPAVTGIPDNPEIGFIERRTPLGRLGQPEEVAALCQFLASDEAVYITGQKICDRWWADGWLDGIRTGCARECSRRGGGWMTF